MPEYYSAEQLSELEEGWWFYDHAWSLLHSIVKKLSGQSVLDVGCGTGLSLSVIKAINPSRQCLGIEPTDEFVEIWKIRNVLVKQASATQLPLENNSFDTVYSSHVLEHIEDHLSAAKEIIRVAKSKAIIIVPEGNCDDKNLGTPHLRYYNRTNFQSLIQEASSENDHKISYSYHQHSLINSLIAEIEIR